MPQTYADGAETAKQKITDAFSLAISQKNSSPVQINISPHTLSAKDSGQLKNIVGEFLSKSKALLNEDVIEDFEDSLHPVLEQENKNDPSGIKNRQAFGKLVSLGGRFIRLKTQDSGHIRVEKLSMLTIGFRVSKSHRIQVNDFLDIQFTLDDIKKSLVKRRIVVRKIKGNYIDADFYNPPPYAKNLGFYLMGG